MVIFYIIGLRLNRGLNNNNNINNNNFILYRNILASADPVILYINNRPVSLLGLARDFFLSYMIRYFYTLEEVLLTQFPSGRRFKPGKEGIFLYYIITARNFTVAFITDTASSAAHIVRIYLYKIYKYILL